MEDYFLYLICIFILVFLLTCAVIYLWRPKWALMSDVVGWEDEVNMWTTFNFAILIGLLVVIGFSAGWVTYFCERTDNAILMNKNFL